MKPYICYYNGKVYKREGECNRCGKCCQFFKKPCPYLKFENNLATCLVHDKLSETPPIPGSATPYGCALFPDSPKDLETIGVKDVCSYKFVEIPHVLVACPTHISKDYAFQKWIDVVKNLTYPNYDILVVDNSPKLEMLEKYKNQVTIIADPQDEKVNKVTRINHSMEIIRQKFLEGDYLKWFNLEADVIPGYDILDILMKFKDAAWVGHAYPIRERHDNQEMSSGIGCTLLDRSIIEKYSFSGVDESPDCAFWNWVQEQVSQRTNHREGGWFPIYEAVELYGHCPIKHLDG